MMSDFGEWERMPCFQQRKQESRWPNNQKRNDDPMQRWDCSRGVSCAVWATRDSEQFGDDSPQTLYQAATSGVYGRGRAFSKKAVATEKVLCAVFLLVGSKTGRRLWPYAKTAPEKRWQGCRCLIVLGSGMCCLSTEGHSGCDSMRQSQWPAAIICWGKEAVCPVRRRRCLRPFNKTWHTQRSRFSLSHCISSFILLPQAL